MNKLLKPFHEQFKDFIDILSYKKSITIGTLGPIGTSSENTFKYLKEQLNIECPSAEINLKLSNNFEEIFNALDSGIIDYALIPSAYEKITDFFWANDFNNMLSFVYNTPEYGVVAKKGFKYKDLDTIKVASCPAVENILKQFINDIDIRQSVEKVRTFSTTEAIVNMIEGKSDIAITNQTSFDKYKDEHDIEFISSSFNAQIVWTIFSQKSKQVLNVSV